MSGIYRMKNRRKQLDNKSLQAACSKNSQSHKPHNNEANSQRRNAAFPHIAVESDA